MQDKYGGAVIMAGVRLHVCQVIRPRMGQSRLYNIAAIKILL